ncbi:MAG: hypothetical protein P3X22_001555 [Thermoprotei archaeon]|nr:hypothetical protein [Thermoprotei archaeon]
MCSYGPQTLPGTGLKVLGKGHAAVVVAALLEELVVAVKARRIDSKRDSLLWEARALAEASRAGVAPRPLYWDDDLIVMDLVVGPRLGDLLGGGETPTWALLEALKAARTLDVIGIEHLELSRPWRSVVFTGGYEKAKALIIDYESSRRGCGNVLRILGGLLPAIGVDMTGMRESLTEYKRNCDRSAYNIVERELLKLLEHLNPGGPGRAL